MEVISDKINVRISDEELWAFIKEKTGKDFSDFSIYDFSIMDDGIELILER